MLIPVFTYTVNANFARGNVDDASREQVARWRTRPWTPDEHPENGISTYNRHRDGSGGQVLDLLPVDLGEIGVQPDGWRRFCRKLLFDRPLVPLKPLELGLQRV